MHHAYLLFSQLITFAVHLGHSIKNTILFSAWYVFKFRHDLAFIHLDKFILFYNLSILFIVGVIGSQSPVWFSNLDISMDRFIRFCAYYCGEFSVTKGWIGGLASNFGCILKAYKRMLLLPGFLQNRHKQLTTTIFEEFFLSRYTWPRCIFFSSIYHSSWACIDATYGLVPAIGISDTNTYSHITSSPIPGSDDSIKTIIFYNSLISTLILRLKFMSITNWFYFNRSYDRVNNFFFFKNLEPKKKVSIYENTVPERFINYMEILKKGVSVLASYGSSSKGYKEGFDLFDFNYYSKYRLLPYFYHKYIRSKLTFLLVGSVNFGARRYFRRFTLNYFHFKWNFLIPDTNNKFNFLSGYSFKNFFLRYFFKYLRGFNNRKNLAFYFFRSIVTVFLFYSFKQFKLIRERNTIGSLTQKYFFKIALTHFYSFLKLKIPVFAEQMYISSKVMSFWKSFNYMPNAKRFIFSKIAVFETDTFVTRELFNYERKIFRDKVKLKIKLDNVNKIKFFRDDWVLDDDLSEKLFRKNFFYFFNNVRHILPSIYNKDFYFTWRRSRFRFETAYRFPKFHVFSYVYSLYNKNYKDLYLKSVNFLNFFGTSRILPKLNTSFRSPNRLKGNFYWF